MVSKLKSIKLSFCFLKFSKYSDKEIYELDEVDNIQLCNSRFIISNLSPGKIEVISAQDYSKFCGKRYAPKGKLSPKSKSKEKKKISPEVFQKLERKHMMTYVVLKK